MSSKIINPILGLLSFVCALALQSCSGISDKFANTIDIPEEKKVEIAILTPLSGSYADLGEEYAKLIKMGLEDGLTGNISITIYDAADEAKALVSMNKIVAKNTKIILGPLTSPITSFIAPKAKSSGIIVITMSNNPVLADDKLYVFGHAPSKQIKPLFDYFFENNYKSFITLLTAGGHSQNVNKIIQNTIIQNHATLVRSEFYTETPESISNAVKIVSDTVDNINEIEDEHLRKTVVYLGDDQTSLRMIFDRLHSLNLDKKAIIAGDNRLDFAYNPDVDIIFSGSLNILNSNVSERARSLNIHYITFMHALAYDLGKMTAEYLGEEFIENRFISRLNSKVPYQGVSGNTYFIDNIAQRKYDIISRVNDHYTTLPDTNSMHK
jgi:Periplasmic binding protein